MMEIDAFSSLGLRDGLLLVAAYGVGCLVAGYYWVLWRTGADIREFGSGNAGARNAGRMLGRSAFVITSLFDISKAVLVVVTARLAELDELTVAAVAVAVVAGHIWPAPLGFRGGKGLAAAFGAVMGLNPIWACALWGIFFGLRLIVTVPSVRVLTAFAVLPMLALAQGRGDAIVVATALLAALLGLTHRKNLIEECGRVYWRSNSRARGSASSARMQS